MSAETCNRCGHVKQGHNTKGCFYGMCPCTAFAPAQAATVPVLPIDQAADKLVDGLLSKARTNTRWCADCMAVTLAEKHPFTVCDACWEKMYPRNDIAPDAEVARLRAEVAALRKRVAELLGLIDQANRNFDEIDAQRDEASRCLDVATKALEYYCDVNDRGNAAREALAAIRELAKGDA